MTKKPATIRDIALLAQVSVPTVSRVLNGQSTVDPQMRDRVKAAAQQLQFRPNRVAQNLILNQGRTFGALGCVLPDITSPYFSRLFLEIEIYAFELGYTIFLGNSANNLALEATYLDKLADRQIDGLLLLGGRANIEQPSLNLLQSTHDLAERLPIVCVNGNVPVERVFSVNSDEGGGTRALLNYLHKLGHTQIAFLGGSAEVTSTLIKLETYREFNRFHKQEIPVEWVQPTGFDVTAGQQAMQQLLQASTHPTAAICVNDLVAAGALQAARAASIRIPEDFSLTGFDNAVLANLVSPTLTTVDHNYTELARLAVDVLLQAIEGKSPPQKSLVTTQMVVRESVAQLLVAKPTKRKTAKRL